MLVFKYLIFSVFAIVVNMSVQVGCSYVYQGFYSFYVQLLLGTFFGLVVKYILDKKYIFYYQSNGSRQEVKSVFLYTLTGSFTTLIFWGTEIGFDIFFSTKNARYIGGALGLSLGYFIKYMLDKNIVFIPSKS